MRTWVIWLTTALFIESSLLVVFFTHNRSLRAALTVAQALSRPLTVPTNAASGSFIYRVAEPALPSDAPTLPNSITSSVHAKIPDGVELRAWKYIVIHHSATSGGSAQAFEAYHRSRGMNNGLAYHFVVDNGSNDTDDGNIEIGSRWLKQLAGGHCKQDSVNEQAIGICLVGDFTQRHPSDKQMKSLAQLVFDLQKQFSIPSENILGHGHVVGEFSECPGKSFPWETFRVALAKVIEADRIEKQAAFTVRPITPPITPYFWRASAYEE